ncbi:MAG TPA: ABC transporter permease [Steroidobacteraceae bacterium]|nr:ABC transporter permease [Steroidobacteraceae bacterium]
MTRAVLTVWRKEVTENFRDRRTLLSALLFGPLFGPFLLALMINLMLQKTVNQADQKVQLAVTDSARAPNLIRFLEEHDVVVLRVELDQAGARRAIRDGRHQMVLLIPPEYPERLRTGLPAPLKLISDASDNQTGKYASHVRALLNGYSSQLAGSRLLARGVSPEVIRPVVVDDIDVSTPAGRALLVLGMMTYFILFAMLMGGLYLAIDATAGERERGSLEPLLSVPVPRQALIYGKVLAACCYMLGSLAIALLAFTVALALVPLEALGMTANFDPRVAFKVFLVAAPFVLLGAALMTVVASFTRTYREAQSYLTVVLLVPTLPILFAGLYSLRPSTWLMAIPSLSQHLLITNLLRDEPLQPLHVLVSIATTLGAGLLLTWLAGRLYQREAILG